MRWMRARRRRAVRRSDARAPSPASACSATELSVERRLRTLQVGTSSRFPSPSRPRQPLLLWPLPELCSSVSLWPNRLLCSSGPLALRPESALGCHTRSRPRISLPSLAPSAPFRLRFFAVGTTPLRLGPLEPRTALRYAAAAIFLRTAVPPTAAAAMINNRKNTRALVERPERLASIWIGAPPLMLRK